MEVAPSAKVNSRLFTARDNFEINKINNFIQLIETQSLTTNKTVITMEKKKSHKKDN